MLVVHRKRTNKLTASLDALNAPLFSGTLGASRALPDPLSLPT